MPKFYRKRVRVLLGMSAAIAAITGLPAVAQAGTTQSDLLCIGLQCADLTGLDVVPEAQRPAPAAAGLSQLKDQSQSGFYEIPAPVYQGAIQPRSVVYLVKPGRLDEAPGSVRGLTVVRDLELSLGSRLDSATLVVIDSGMARVIPAEWAGAAAQRPKARTASEPIHGCPQRYFCLFGAEGFGGYMDPWHGPTYAGAGWVNNGTNFGSSMVNYRDGDTLLADGQNGNGTRYCAQQQSEDSTFSNNPIGNSSASSVALLGSSPDRC